MVTITRDLSFSHSDRFTIKLASGIRGVRSVTYKHATLEEAQLALAHYFGSPLHHYAYGLGSNCIVCRDDVDR